MQDQLKKILIIDDDSRNIFALKAVLTAKKYACLAANSAAEGFAIIKNEDVAVVLLDMMMPEMDGYQALAKMKQDADLREIPVIAVTAQAMVGDKERCLDAGASGYISKPVNVEELIKLLNNYL